MAVIFATKHFIEMTELGHSDVELIFSHSYDQIGTVFWMVWINKTFECAGCFWKV